MRQSYKTIGLWVVLITLFVAFYQVFSHPTDGSHPSHPSGPKGDWWFCAAAAVLLIGIIGFTIWRGRGNWKLNNEGIQLLHQGRYLQALEKFEASAKKESKSPVAPFNIGIAQLALWRTREARQQFEKAWALLEKPAKRVVIHAGSPEAIKSVIPQHVALACALDGDVSSAREWLAKAVEGPEGTRWAILTRGALACRAGDFATAVRELDNFEVKQLGGGTGALVNALRAWAIERTTGELRHVDRVLLFGETGPQAVQKVWPELAAFVERAPAA